MRKTVLKIFLLAFLAVTLTAGAQADTQVIGPLYKVTVKVLKVAGTKQIAANRPNGGGPYQTHAYKLRVGVLDVKQIDEEKGPISPRDFAYRRGVDFEVVAVPTYDMRAVTIEEDIYVQGYLQKVSDPSGESHRLQITDSSGRI